MRRHDLNVSINTTLCDVVLAGKHHCAPLCVFNDLCTFWGALITPMLYPNCRDPRTAVKTDRTKVPVTVWKHKAMVLSGGYLEHNTTPKPSNVMELWSFDPPTMLLTTLQHKILLSHQASTPVSTVTDVFGDNRPSVYIPGRHFICHCLPSQSAFWWLTMSFDLLDHNKAMTTWSAGILKMRASKQWTCDWSF